MSLFKAQQYTDKKQNIQSLIGIACLLLMIAGYLFSRALLSIAPVILFLNAFWTGNISLIKKRFTSNQFQFWAVLFWIVAVSSYFWTSNKDFWAKEVAIQIPFLLLPIGFCSVPLEKIEVRRLLFITASTLSIIAVIGSLVVYYSNYEYYTQNYKLSIPMPTTLTGDHIRFSLWLSTMVLFSFYHLFLDGQFRINKKLKMLAWLSIALFTIYLHILSAKTGLLMLYIVLVAAGYYIFSKKYKNVLVRVLPFVITLAGIGLAYVSIPTFTTKVDYVVGELKEVYEGKKLNYNLSDHGRIISVEVGLQEIKKNGIIGTGAGDVLDDMRKGYETEYPEVPKGLRFMPFNQYVLNIMAFGWILSLPLFMLSITPFFKRARNGQFFIDLLAFIMILTMMYEGTLMLQTGVFVYLFSMLWALSFRWTDIILPENENAPTSKN